MTQLSSEKTTRSGAAKSGRIKAWTLLLLTAGVMAVQTPCEAKIKWKDVLGVLCTVGGVVSGATGNVPLGGALIGLQGTLLTSSAIIAGNTNVVTGPDVLPPGLLGLGSTDHSPAAIEAFLAMNCPDVPVAGTPGEQIFIQKANVVIGLGRQLRTAPPAVMSHILQQMSVALEDAGNAYDALGLTNELTQTQWDNFKLDCAADGVAPQLEENYLIACGLTPAQRFALNQDQAAQRSVLDHRIKYKPGTVLHQSAARFNTNNVGFVDLLHLPIGDASLSQPPTGTGVHVQLSSTVGSLGGVKIELPSVTEWNGYWSELDANDALPAGAFVESSATGDVFGSITNGPIGSWRMTKLGTSNYMVTADFSPVGATQVTLMIFNGTNLVYTGSGQSGPLCFVNGCVSDDHWGRPTTKPGFGGALTLRGPKDITIGTSLVVGDRIAIVPDSTPLITSFSSVSVIASGVPSITITNETTPASRIYPGPKWLVLGIPGFTGGCFPGFGICSFSPFPYPDTTPVLFSYQNGLTMEFTAEQSNATNVFTVANELTLDEDTARDLGFAALKIRPGQYPVDFSQNPFGTVHLDSEAKSITLTLEATGLVNISWPCDGERVLQIADSVTGPWIDAPVQVMKLRESPSLPSRYYQVKSSK